MGIYPKKKVMAGRFGFDTAKVQEGLDSGKLEAGAGMINASSGFISNIGKKSIGYGVSYQGVGSATAGSAIDMGSKGLKIGSKFGAPGAIIGAGVGIVAGGVTGFVNGKQAKEKALSQFKTNMSGELNKQAKQSRINYAGLAGYKATSYKNGGPIDVSKKAVIMGGNLHKDGGNPIVNTDSGEKIAETEREELLLTSTQTSEIEDFIRVYENKKLNNTLENLGKRFQEIILNETIDNSGIYA
jgi:hypothetical protein